MSDVYDPSDEGPEAKMAREIARAEARWQERCETVVGNLLHSLRPEDASRRCFTWSEIKTFLLKRSH